MHETQWQLPPKILRDDRAFQDELLNVHREIYDDFFSDDPLANSELGFHLHDYRRTSGWRVVMILTPWMMSRLLFPDKDPEVVIPVGWSGEERGETEYQALGPSLRLGWSGDYMQAHLNFHPRLGHYLLQPISLNMRPYATPHEAFRAWNDIIRTRHRNMAQIKKQPSQQEQGSCKEFLLNHFMNQAT